MAVYEFINPAGRSDLASTGGAEMLNLASQASRRNWLRRT